MSKDKHKTIQIPDRVYFCPVHNTFKDRPEECYWYRNPNICLANGKCKATELIAMPKEIEAELVNEIDSLLEKYDTADPPIDRTKLAVELIEKARGL